MKILVIKLSWLLIIGIISISSSALDFETPIVGHWPRNTIKGAEGVVVSGNYAYLADGQRGVQIIDVADRTNPSWVSDIATLDYAMNVICVGNHLYVADRHGGLNIIDVANPSAPQGIGVLTITNCSDLDVSGGYVYLVRGSAGLAIVDVRQPSNPVLATNVALPAPAIGVAVSSTRAYAAFNAGFVTIDISDPAQPRTLSTNVGGYGIRLHQNVLYTGVAALDVSNPDVPITLPTPPLSPWISFYVSGGYFGRIYGEDGMEFLDITSPSNSIRTGYFSAEWPAAYVADGYAYIIDRAPIGLRDGGLYIAKLKERANPQRQATLSIGSGSGWETVVWNNYAYAAVNRFIYVYSISNAMSPVQVATLDSSFRFAIQNLAVGGDRLYASSSDIVNVFDMRIPQSPVFLARFTNQVWVDDMVASSNYLFVAGGYSRPFMILDVTVPSQPRQIFESAGTVYDLDSFGDLLCLNISDEGTYGFKLMDLSNPGAPQALCLFTNDAPIENLCLKASFVYFTDSEYYLKAVDISNPAQPFLAGSSRLDQWRLSYQLVVSEAFAYIAAGTRGLVVYDIGNPGRIRYVGGNSSINCQALAPFAQSICAAGNTFSILDRFHPLAVSIAESTNRLELRVNGPPRQLLTVQNSSNLLNWFDLMSISPTNPPTTISVTNDNSRSFYRTVWH